MSPVDFGALLALARTSSSGCSCGSANPEFPIWPFFSSYCEAIPSFFGALGTPNSRSGARESPRRAPDSQKLSLNGHKDAPFPLVSGACRRPGRSSCCRQRRRAKRSDSLDDRGEQPARDRDLCHLKGDVPPVADDLCADFDQLLAKRCQRPLRNRLWNRQRAEEVAEVVG